MTYTIEFASASDNGDGTYTLTEICDFHHIQPLDDVIIDDNPYIVTDYDEDARTLSLSGTESISVTSFTINGPLFIHGTPIEENNELNKIQDQSIKSKLIYLMEPYDTIDDYPLDSAIDRRCKFTLCFLANADMNNNLTDDFYHKAIRAMKNLMEDVLDKLDDSNLFSPAKRSDSPRFYPRFGINIKDSGTKKLYFSENLSGLAIDILLEIDKDESCSCEPDPVVIDLSNTASLSANYWDPNTSNFDFGNWHYSSITGILSRAAGNDDSVYLTIADNAEATNFFLVEFDIITTSGALQTTLNGADSFPVQTTSFHYKRMLYYGGGSDCILQFGTNNTDTETHGEWIGSIRNIVIRKILETRS